LPAVTIRRAETGDAARLSDLAYRAWESWIFPLLTPRPGMQQAERTRLAQVVAETLNRIIVAEVDGVVVGWCSRSARRAYIPYLFVAPELQRQGLGSMLLRRMESMLELEGASRVYLEPRRTMSPRSASLKSRAITFWRCARTGRPAMNRS
jgi:ribosomal-protein-alanine N-acetyltransferase